MDIYSTIKPRYVSTPPPPKIDSPERNLIASMLHRAVLDLSNPEYTTRKNASSWILSNKGPESPFSLRWCLEQLDIMQTEAAFIQYAINSIHEKFSEIPIVHNGKY